MSAELQRHPKPGLSSGARSGRFPLQDTMPLAREIKGDRGGWATGDSQGPSHSQAALGLPQAGAALCCLWPPSMVILLPAGAADDRELPAVPPAQGPERLAPHELSSRR